MDQEAGETVSRLITSREARDALVKQFESPEILEIDGRKVEVVDIRPKNQKTNIPVVVAPGWAATPEVFRDNILALAESGRRTISVKLYHGIETDKIDGYPDAELRKMAAVVRTLEEKGVEKVDAVGHSEAGAYLTIAATLFPDKFRNIILVNPAGMIGQDDIASLSIRFSSDVVDEIANSFKNRHHIKQILRSFSEAGKAVASNPLQALKQGIAISGTQIQEQLKKLKEKGIGISIIHAGKDKAFPMDRVQRVARSEQLHGFYSVTGSHNQIYLEPRRYSLVVDEALTALEKRKK